MIGLAPYKILRYGPNGYYQDGLWVEDPQTTLTIQASVQPLSPEELQALPEGVRSQRPMKFYTKSKLQGARNGQRPDILIYHGEEYEIQGIEEHNMNAPLPHYKYLCWRVGDVI